MASSGDDLSELDQFGLYQLAEQEIDKDLSPDTWGPGNSFNADIDWAGLQNLLPPDVSPENLFQNYFDEFEAAPTVEDALAVPFPGQMMSASQDIPGVQIPPQYPPQAVQQFPQYYPQQAVQQYPQQYLQQYPQPYHQQYHQQYPQQYPQQAIQQHPQHPQPAQQVSRQVPQRVSQPTPRLDHQLISSQGYNHVSTPTHPQTPPNPHMGANDQAIPAHQLPQNNQDQISPSSQNNVMVNTQASQGSVDAPDQITPRSQTSANDHPGSTMHAKPDNAEENAGVNITPHSESTQVTAVNRNEMRCRRASDFPHPQQTDDVFSEISQSPVLQYEVHGDHSDKRLAFHPPVPAVGRPAMGSMKTEGGLVVGPCQIPNFVPDIEELLDPENSGADTQTIYQNSREALEAMCVVHPELQTLRDRTIPTTDQQKRAIVKALLNAMKSLVYAEDSQAMKRPFVQGKYSDARLEAACWTLLDLTLLRHRQGPLLGGVTDKYRGGEAIGTFGQRISLIMTGLEVNKTIVKHVLDPNYTASLVDDPVGSMKRIVSNKQLNRRKGEYMTLGKELLQNEQANSHDKKNSRRGNQSIPIRTTPTPLQTSPAPTQTSGVMTRSQARRIGSQRGQISSRAPNMATHAPTVHRYPANHPMTPATHAPTETQAMPNGGYRAPAQHAAYHPLGGLPVNTQPAPHARAPMVQNNLINGNGDMVSQETRSPSPLFVGPVGYGCATAVASLSARTHSRTPSTPHSVRGHKRQASDAGFGSGSSSDKRRC